MFTMMHGFDEKSMCFLGEWTLNLGTILGRRRDIQDFDTQKSFFIYLSQKL